MTPRFKALSAIVSSIETLTITALSVEYAFLVGRFGNDEMLFNNRSGNSCGRLPAIGVPVTTYQGKRLVKDLRVFLRTF
ncbi:hypothetical protein C8E00_1181 [Chromohalobacter marismortui]|uniref:Uncharacterized protein n=1 Tax=Chromohalobacter marismortui TaxID=42055 RepID=A0A4R7NDC5_9GAMM|nr:hypothetical protein C8E00_1181 [Chromohalobacter marismortui]